MDYNMGPYKMNHRGKFSPIEKYKYMDSVKYNGSSYVNINRDNVDGTACIGVLPEGDINSELYWQCYCEKGDKGDTPDVYPPFITIELNGVWDYSQTDKIIVPTNMNNTLTINNVYNGACGIILTSNTDLKLPANSEFSIDFDYITISGNQYYLYSFICVPADNKIKFIWNRTVINRG